MGEHRILPKNQSDYNKGYELEEKVYEGLVSIGFKNIVYETELRQKYGWNSASIDFLIVLDDGFIAIQTKYKSSRRRENKGISNFIRSLDYITETYKQHFGKNLICGLWVSRIEPFNDNKEYLGQRGVHCISQYGSVNELAKHTTDWLKVHFAQGNTPVM